MTNEKIKEIDLGGDFGAVAFKVNGLCVEIGADGESVRVVSDTPTKIKFSVGITPPKTSTAITAAKDILEIGDRMRDGTIVIAIDIKSNIALFAPESIFVGETTFDNQNDVVKQANSGKGLHGHKDWRRLTDFEPRELARSWDKVAPPASQGRNPPIFWSETPKGDLFAYRFEGGDTRWSDSPRESTHLVPVIRSGPARSCMS